jgi:hypothetical protein
MLLMAVPKLSMKLAGKKKKLRDYLNSQFSHFLEMPAFVDSLPGHLFPDDASQRRLPTVIRRLKDLASL